MYGWMSYDVEQAAPAVTLCMILFGVHDPGSFWDWDATTLGMVSQ